VSVFVALGEQHAMRMCHNVIRGISGFTVFFHIISLSGMIVEKNKKKALQTKKCVF